MGDGELPSARLLFQVKLGACQLGQLNLDPEFHNPRAQQQQLAGDLSCL